MNLDENNVPERLDWKASDTGQESECKAVMLAVWDGNSRETLRIDLWNKEMQVDEMKMFMHQALMTMADTLERATGEQRMAMSMRDFGDYFAEKLGISGGDITG